MFCCISEEDGYSDRELWQYGCDSIGEMRPPLALEKITGDDHEEGHAVGSANPWRASRIHELQLSCVWAEGDGP